MKLSDLMSEMSENAGGKNEDCSEFVFYCVKAFMMKSLMVEFVYSDYFSGISGLCFATAPSPQQAQASSASNRRALHTTSKRFQKDHEHDRFWSISNRRAADAA